MKNKKLVSKIGAIALCAVMAAGSVVSINAAVVDDSEVGSLGYGRKVISLDSTGQTVLCKKGYKFPNSNITVSKDFKMAQIKLGKCETLKYTLYSNVGCDRDKVRVEACAYKSIINLKKKAEWSNLDTAGNLTTDVSTLGRVNSKKWKSTVQIKGNKKCTYNLIAYDLYSFNANYPSDRQSSFRGGSYKDAYVLNMNYPVVAVSVYDAPSSVALKRNDNKSSISGKTVTLKKGQTLSVYESTPKGSYANAKNVIYSSSNKKVATVTKNSTFSGAAKIKAVKKGTSKITVKLYNGKTAWVKVNVK